MNVHKGIRLTLHDRQAIWRLHSENKWRKVNLAKHFRVSRPTIDKVIERARKQEFTPRKSMNKRYLSIKYGIKRLAKIKRLLELKLKNRA